MAGLNFSWLKPNYKYIIIGLLVGVCAGFGAIAFDFAVEMSQKFFTEYLIGMKLPGTASEGGASYMSSVRPYLIPISIALGGFVSGVIVYKFAPDAAGHGTDSVISSYHNRKRIPARVPLVKAIASAITIGSGGSAGKEGPITQIVAGMGSFIAEKLGFDEKDRSIAIAAGIGAGIGAIFKVPIGGALISAEILYRKDMETEVIYPSLIASAIGYSIFGLFKGFQPIFGQYAFTFNPATLPLYAAEGIAAGFLAIFFIKAFYGVSGAFGKMRISKYAKPLIGCALAGLAAMLFPQVMGAGYGWVQVLMDGRLGEFNSLGLPLLLMLALFPLLKIAATSLTVGSGASGGIFAPGMVIGAGLGAFCGHVFHLVLPGVVPSIAPFVVVGMMCFFGAAGKVSLSIMPMVVEMTGSLQLLPAAMIATVIATVVTGKNTMYRAQMQDRSASAEMRKKEIGEKFSP